eukprot:Nitzschia sp. Nitz4//scaffold71_size96697//48045//50047//NITZ4_004696-RA/size96697-snap-gene-0.41-mRNA-1//-1//CDS//3329557250//3562//frame0
MLRSSTARPNKSSAGTGFASPPSLHKKRKGTTPLTLLNAYFVIITVVVAVALLGSLYSVFHSLNDVKQPDNGNQKGGVQNVPNNDSKPHQPPMLVPRPNVPKVVPAVPNQSVNANQLLNQIRSQFAERYGRLSSKILENGLEVFGSVDVSAARMLEAKRNGRPFVMAFSGYSVTVGRGNYFNQSFPFEVQRILKEPMQQLLGIDLVVRNAAIGGIPSYPYSFCLEHFVGADVDFLSWDYSMNEGKGAAVLESFVRQAMKQLPRRPMLMILDKKKTRTGLLKEYTKGGLIEDAIAVGRTSDILEDKAWEGISPLPAGFEDWNKFGTPNHCPGHGPWHPKVQEHNMIAWLVAMHFLTVLERAYELEKSGEDYPKPPEHTAEVSFPAASGSIEGNPEDVTHLLFGHPNEDATSYLMKDLSCRTSFIPAMDETKKLPNVIVSGFSKEELDIMEDRSLENYKAGWVLDVSAIERTTKRKVESCGGFGYIDMKIAVYGIPESGTLRLWLPFEGQEHDHEHGEGDTNADHWFDGFVICEANESRKDPACKLDQDLEVTVGGAAVSSIQSIKGAAEYLQRSTCVNVGIPKEAQSTPLSKVTDVSGQPLSAETKAAFGVSEDTVGLVVDIQAKSRD